MRAKRVRLLKRMAGEVGIPWKVIRRVWMRRGKPRPIERPRKPRRTWAEVQAAWQERKRVEAGAKKP